MVEEKTVGTSASSCADRLDWGRSLPEPRTELARIIIKYRKKMAEEGIPFLTEEELDREIAEVKGRPYPDDDE